METSAVVQTKDRTESEMVKATAPIKRTTPKTKNHGRLNQRVRLIVVVVTVGLFLPLSWVLSGDRRCNRYYCNLDRRSRGVAAILSKRDLKQYQTPRVKIKLDKLSRVLVKGHLITSPDVSTHLPPG